MTDPRFRRAVIFICQHDTEAAMGLVINQPNTDLSFKKLVEHLNLNQSCLDTEGPVYTGPVEPQRGYILHTDDQMLAETIPIANGICLSLHVDMISEITRGLGPSFVRVMLGYAGWSAGQLEDECVKICGCICLQQKTFCSKQIQMICGIKALPVLA